MTEPQQMLQFPDKPKFLGNNAYACNDCFPDVREISKLDDRFWLIKWRDEYHLIDSPHLEKGEGPFLTFPDKPVPFSECSKWEESLEALEMSLYYPPDDGYRLVKALQAVGYDIETMEVAFFLLHWAGLVIEQWEKTNG